MNELEILEQPEELLADELADEPIEELSIAEILSELLDERFELLETERQELILEVRTLNEQIAVQNEFLVHFWWIAIVFLVCKFIHFLFFRLFFGGIT